MDVVGVGWDASPPSCGFGWVGVSQFEELRRPCVSLYGMGMREYSYMD